MQLADKAGGFTFQHISRYERSELDAGNMTLRKLSHFATLRTCLIRANCSKPLKLSKMRPRNRENSQMLTMSKRPVLCVEVARCFADSL